MVKKMRKTPHRSKKTHNSNETHSSKASDIDQTTAFIRLLTEGQVHEAVQLANSAIQDKNYTTRTLEGLGAVVRCAHNPYSLLGATHIATFSDKSPSSSTVKPK